MPKRKISSVECAMITAPVIFTNAYSVMSGAVAGRMVWISNLMASVVGALLAFLLATAVDLLNGRSICEVTEKVFGKIFGKAVCISLVLFSVTTCVVSLTVFSRFVQITALPQTPQIIIPLAVISIALLAVKKSVRTLSGSARLLFLFLAVTFIGFMIFGAGNFEKSVFNVFKIRKEKVLLGAAEVMLNRFGSIFALLSVYLRTERKKSTKYVFAGSVLISGMALAAISAYAVSTLGEKTARLSFYPIFTALSVQSLGGFIQHTEIFACIAMTISVFFKTSVCLLFADDVVSDVFKVSRQKSVALPFALGISALTQMIYRDISSLRSMVEWKPWASCVLVYQLVVPLAVFLAVVIYKKSIKTG